MASTPFVGPTYNLDSRPASVQRTINLVPVPLEPGNERTGWVFKDVPGLVAVVQVVGPLYYTSWPYPLFADETLDADLSIPQSGILWIPPLEQLDADLSIPMSGLLDVVLELYNNHIAEPLDADLSIPQSGTLPTVLVVYDDALPDTLDADLSVPQSGELDVVLILYSNWPADPLDADLSIPLSGTLSP